MKISTLLPVALLAGLATSSCSAEDTTEILVDVSERKQVVQGFGCSINGWTAPMIPLYYDESFADYAANELGMSVFRLQMWGEISPDPVENWEDISYKDFKWKGPGLRGKVNVDWAKAMVEANPEVRIIGSVWSPPHWMKDNDSLSGTASGYLLSETRDFDDGNRLKDSHYKYFAKWVVEWCRYMESQGTPFYAISLQNELLFTQWFESAMYSPEEYAKVVKVTGEMFESEGVKKPLFYGPEDMTLANYNDATRHKPYVDALLEPEIAQYFDVFATHGYTDGVQTDRKNSTVAYWNSIKQFGLPYWVTEGGSGGHEWPQPVTTGIAPRLHVALEESNVSLFCGWQLAGEEGARGSEHDFMSYSEPTKKTFATMHYWKHIRPGAERVETKLPEDAVLLASSYVDEERGALTTVLINQTETNQAVEITYLNNRYDYSWSAFQTTESLNHAAVELEESAADKVRLNLPALSVTTLVGRKL